METEKQRQHRREADQERRRQKRAATCDTYRITKQQRMAARRALGTSKARLVFRYEISDLFAEVAFCHFLGLRHGRSCNSK